ncbi:unnamed protein product [Rhizophagus irregularis]|nr:unnamed protein product [Rhizophagus irregularis]
MFKRSGTNNNDNDYAGTSGSGNNFNVSEVIDDTDHKSDREVEKYMPPHRRESRKNYSPPRQRNYSPPRQRNYSSPRQRNYSQPRQRDYSSPRQRNYLQPTQRNYSPPPRQGNYLSPRQRDYSPPRQRNYLQPTQRNYPPQSPRQGNIFSFSELTHKGSDKIIFITNGEEIKNSAWKRVLRKKNPLNQNDVRIFVSSALSATDSQVDYGAEELVTELGNPDGLKKLREIINFRSMSCDAGLDKRVLSFQYVVLPLLGVLTRTTITECTLENYVHAIFMVVYTNLDSFLYDGVMKMLETLVQRNSLVDNCISVEDLLSEEPYSFIPTS